mmetsp:Transcript_4484/g.11790  ORF Transcript_4484/g.11790 Transcript_4484/m.11790 type:complete len:85 (-) Transcript_4484:1826-2080(-)
MFAIFNFSSILLLLTLMICTCTYLRELRPTIFDAGKPRENKRAHEDRDGLVGFCWKLSRIGERLSPFVSVACVMMSLHVLFFKE